ncbi:efflux RND transporter permease subunit [Akkermansiaceae bacterium]|nr:efflux RND transporter permease subunit [Akkermansiaceae bacterium]
MLNLLINFSLAQRALIVSLAVIVLVLGVQKTTELPVDVLPDLTKPTVTILTECPGHSPEEVETRVTIPLEQSLMGVNGLNRLRTTSDIGLSLTFVEFDWGTDIYQARQFVQERLSAVDLPEGVTPYMTPATSLMGNIMLVSLLDPSGMTSPEELRTQADWVIARRLQSIPGIAEVLPMGGGIRQIQVQPDPQRMLALGVTYDELREAAANAVRNTTGGYIEGNDQEIMVRNLAMTTDLNRIAQTTVRHENDRPLRIQDVAKVVWDTEPMRGDAGSTSLETEGAFPAVILSITKAPGYDTLALTNQLESALTDLRKTLPEGAELIVSYRQADYINLSLTNLEDALLHGAIMVALVLILFLLNFRITLITLTAIPLSLAISILVFSLFDLGINSMTLGGFAVAIGMVVDDAIVDVENVYRRLRETPSKPRLKVIAEASSEVRSSILYATVLIILVFVPLLSLSGVAGRLFSPIAFATIISMAASFLVSLTVIPVLSSFLLRPKADVEHKDALFLQLIKTVFEKTFLRFTLAQPFVIIALAALLVAMGFSIFPTMGRNFLPTFREPTTVIATAASPGTSLQKTNEISHTALRLLSEIPEVKAVGYRAGRAENGDHVVPVSTVEFEVEFHEHLERPKDEVIEDLRLAMQNIPGTFSAMSSPLGDRIGHMLSGVAAKVAIKITGPDLDKISEIGKEVALLAREIPGLEEARPEAQSAIPQLRIEPNPERLLAYGLTPGKLNDQLASLIGGEILTQVYDDQRTYDLVLRLPEEWRESPTKLGSVYLDTQSGIQAPLRDLANIRLASGPNNIQRENTQRRFVVSINPTSENLVELVDQLREKIDKELVLPEGYLISYEGDYLAQQKATEKILYSSVILLLVVIFLLYSYFRSVNFTLQVLIDIPIALTGGILLTRYTLNNISIATLVGFIAIAGISARNSIMMISHYLHLMSHENEDFTKPMIIRGTLERLVPVLMTALSAGVALLPLTMNLGFLPFVEPGDPSAAPGKEILNPVAVVIVGGLITSTLFGLLVTPAVFWLFGEKSAQKAILAKPDSSQ